MAKNLSERMAERAKLKKMSPTSKNKVAFLALQKDIKIAIDEGWSTKDIWDTLIEEQKISFTYKTFRLYVNQYILVASKQPPISQSEEPESMSPHIPKPTNFIFNPNAKAEDLL